MMKLTSTLAIIGLALLFSSGVCYPPAMPSSADIDKLNLPEGFRIVNYAEGVKNARSLARANDFLVFVSTRQKGMLHALIDHNKDYLADEHIVLSDDLDTPNGIAYHQGDLYVALLEEIIVFRNIENNLKPGAPYEVIYSGLPDERHHGWKYLAIGPDNKLYFTVGAPCNVCLREEEIFASICRINTDGSDFEVFAHGVRNSVGFTWHPETSEMWFTDNGRDMMGDDEPGDELNRAAEAGLHFGYPFCHQGNIHDPDFESYSCSDYVPPAQVLGPHVAALGLKFYTGKQFPDSLQNDIFIAEHGSWNRSTPIGYRISRVKMHNNQPASYEPFITGWLQGNGAWGRPVDLMVMDDGSMLISDDHADRVYRLWYEGD
jgi:glucose/arabinose dehydrogenase